MAIYEYYCPTCRSRFELRRPMAAAALSVQCEQGHPAERAISAFAVARTGAAGDPLPAGGAGCGCGGNCACGA
jgi:putative FmdB family regulatory protein